MRKPAESDFDINVEGVGKFSFGRRKMSDEIQVQVEYASLIQGVEPTEWLQTVCGWISVFKVMMVSCPKDWDLEEMDPLDLETYKQMRLVYESFREKEKSFRSRAAETSEAEG
jgi:hypothetical protein